MNVKHIKQIRFVAKSFIISVTLIGGATPRQGNVYSVNPKTGKSGPVCQEGWTIENVSLVTFSKKTFFGKS